MIHNRPNAIILRQAHFLSLSHFYKHNTKLKSETDPKWACLNFMAPGPGLLWTASKDTRKVTDLNLMDLTWSRGLLQCSPINYRKLLTLRTSQTYKETSSKLQHVLHCITKYIKSKYKYLCLDHNACTTLSETLHHVSTWFVLQKKTDNLHPTEMQIKLSTCTWQC